MPTSQSQRCSKCVTLFPSVEDPIEQRAMQMPRRRRLSPTGTQGARDPVNGGGGLFMDSLVLQNDRNR